LFQRRSRRSAGKSESSVRKPRRSQKLDVSFMAISAKLKYMYRIESADTRQSQVKRILNLEVGLQDLADIFIHQVRFVVLQLFQNIHSRH